MTAFGGRIAPMSEVPVAEFPFVAEMPRGEKSKLVKLWDRVTEFRRVSVVEGGLVTVSIAARMLDISRSRIDQLVQAGRLRAVPFEGHVFISGTSIEEFGDKEKSKGGRPRIKPAEMWSMSLDVARKVVPQKK